MAISDRTRKLLWGNAHNQCAFPGCTQALAQNVDGLPAGASTTALVGQEAHIRAQSVGGPRFDPNYSDVDGVDNLVLMCPTHHTLIDANGGVGYKVEDLIKMKSDHERSWRQRDVRRTVRLAYLGDRFEAENTVQFQQVDLRGPSVDSMFVDVPIGCRRDGSPTADLIARIAAEAPGDTAELELTTGFAVTGAAQALLHPEWEGSAVLVGGPGQGKSTLLQYICQFHRARQLSKDEYANEYGAGSSRETMVRFPIRVDLRKYAQWAESSESHKSAKRRRNRPKQTLDENWRSLEEYVIGEVSRHVGAHIFDAHDFADLISSEPVLLALDGLDEVASLEARARVVDEISRVRGRLSPSAFDLVILVATRPGSSLHSLASSGAFSTLYLQRLTQGLRLQYLQRWVVVSRLSTEAASRLQSTFQDNQHVPHINELASFPMQLAILLHLLDRRQLLPQQRTELYREYLKTFLDREQTEDKEPLLAEQRRVVEDTHAYLGWYLQAKAEQGQSAGRISRDELRQLLRSYLAGQPEELELADELYSAITDRVLCLVERDDAFEFEVQSLREYFAALHLFENLSAKGKGNSRDDGLNALLERPYWANTCRFFIGMLAKGEIRALDDNFRVIEKRVAPRPIVRSMAAAILADRIYDGLVNRDIRHVVDIILNGPGIILAEDGALDSAGAPLRFGDRAGRSQAVAHLKDRLGSAEDETTRQALAQSLLAHARGDDNIPTWWWSQFAPTTDWLVTAADLGAFAGLDSMRTTQLRAAHAEVPVPHSWWTDLLIRGGYDGSDEKVVALVLNDLNSGAAETARFFADDTPLAILVTGAAAALAGALRPGLREPSPGSIDPNASVGRVLTATTKLRVLGDPTRWEDWDERLGVLAEAWGDGWVLRRATAIVPNGVDLVGVATRATSDPLRVAARREAQFRAHAADAGWWAGELSAAHDPGAQALALIAVLERARGAVVTALCEQIDTMVHGLEPKRFRAVEEALLAGTVFHRSRALDVHDDIRLGRLKVSGRSLWLIWMVGGDSTREWISANFDRNLQDALLAGTGQGRRAITATPSTRRLKLDTFEGMRTSLPPGGWAAEGRLASLTSNRAKEFLLNPGRWPADLVQLAADHLADASALKVPALADVAATDKWFRDRD
jgi:hypothetical protein